MAGLRRWLTFTVPVADLARFMSELEETHPPANAPILVYIDIERVLIAWVEYTPENER